MIHPSSVWPSPDVPCTQSSSLSVLEIHGDADPIADVMLCDGAGKAVARIIGVHLAEMALSMKATTVPDCLITGGEPTVRLAPPDIRGKGGRNQQLVLAALERLLKEGEKSADGIVLLSGGTDGEDGPTAAAGAMLSAELIAKMREKRLDPSSFLSRNDAYTFFDQIGGLIKTGPTHTNVCDLRVVTVSREQCQSD